MFNNLQIIKNESLMNNTGNIMLKVQ